MPQYHVYFRSGEDAIVGRDDFAAEDDATALQIASLLQDACSDMCERFELWEGARPIVPRPAAKPALSAADFYRRLEEIAIEREIAIRDSRWMIARSKRLLEQMQRLIDKAPGG